MSMNHFDMIGYKANKPYNKQSKTSMLFALVKSAAIFVPIIMFF